MSHEMFKIFFILWIPEISFCNGGIFVEILLLMEKKNSLMGFGHIAMDCFLTKSELSKFQNKILSNFFLQNTSWFVLDLLQYIKMHPLTFIN